MDNEALDLITTVMPTMRGPLDSFKLLGRMNAAMRRMMVDQWAAARSWRPDLIVYHPKCLGASHIAERLDLPAFAAMALPFLTPTRAFPVPVIGRWPLGGAANRASYRLNHLTMVGYGSMINDFRTETLGLGRLSRTDDLMRRRDGTPVPVLYAFSPHLVPRPDDYPAEVHITGSWELGVEPDSPPSEPLVRFLEGGPAPVYVGFGSMGFGKSADQRTAVFVDVLTSHGARVVLATGWGGLRGSPRPDVHVVEAASHEWLFPRCSAVIHHGGSGTTHAGLRAGRPTLVCPFLADQPFWGHRVHDLGAGPEPISSRRLSRRRLEPAVAELLNNPRFTTRAAELGRAISAEDGVAAAVDVIAGYRG